MAHWIRLSLLCRCKWTRKSDLGYGNVSEQHVLLCKNKKVYCVYTRNLLCKKFVSNFKILVHAQDSCACTTLLCMRKTLVHALEGPGTKAGSQKKQRRVRPGAAAFCTCTRILCRQNSCVDTIYHFYFDIMMNTALKHFHTRDEIFPYIYTYIVD